MYNIWGKIKYVDENNTCQGFASGGWYLPYFKQVDSSSNTSRWSKSIYDIDGANSGYYSFDLEDYYILTSEGSYKKGSDRVYIPFFWNKNLNSDKSISSTELTHIAFIDHLTVAGEDGAEINLSLAPINKPTVTYTMPAAEIKTNTEMKMSETSSLNTYKFTPTGCGATYSTEIQQLNLYNSIEIFKNFKLTQSIFDWGDGSSITTDKSGNGTTSSTHKYTKPGIYTLKARVNSGFTSSYSEKTQSVKVAYNEPIVDFSWTSAYNLKGQEKVSLTNNTTNAPDNREALYSYTWEISDTTLAGVDSSVIYTGKLLSYSPDINFKSPGIKTIKLTCKWNDGFEDKTVSKTKTFTISRFATPSLNFNWNSDIAVKGNNVIKYYNTTTLDSDDKRTNATYIYSWTMYDKTLAGIESDNVVNSVTGTTIPNYVYKSSGLKTIKLSCSWNDGFEDKVTEITKSFTLNPFDITLDFVWDFICKSRAEKVTFTNKTTGDTSKINSYLWNIEDSYPKSTSDLYIFSSSEVSKFNEGSPDNTQEILNNKVFTTENVNINFHSEKTKTIKLTINYFDGWENKEKFITKSYTPTHISIQSSVSASTLSPKGRNSNVVFSNVYTDQYNVQYYYDLEINDFYSVCNIDNETSEIKDNYKKYSNVNITATLSHKFQNTENNIVNMTTFYDNGWGRASIKSSVIIKPIVFSEPITDFDWDIKSIENRNTLVTFFDTSVDNDNLILRCNWTIEDMFDIFNPDNPNYGSETDNTKTYTNVSKTFRPQHKFQSLKTHGVAYNFIYDDGFCERESGKHVKFVNTVDTSKFTLSFDVKQENIDVIDLKPKIKTSIINTTQYNLIKETTFILKDRDILTLYDNETTLKGNNVEYTWLHATRKPLCVDNTGTELLKYIEMYIRYDNGWTDSNISSSISKEYKALTNELTDLSAKYINLDWSNSLDIYGKESVKFNVTYNELFDFETSVKWNIEDTNYMLNELTYNFTSAGNKTIDVEVLFNDGYDNEYSLSDNISLEVKKYLQPDLDFEWEGSNLLIDSRITFKSTNINSTRPYTNIKYIKIDYYNNGILDKFDIDGDGINESDTYDVNKTWYNTFNENASPLNIRLIGYWNDGFEDKIIEVIKEIIILDLPPECDIEVELVSNDKYKILITPKKVGDYKYKVEAYIKSPIIETVKCREINDLDSDLPVCSVSSEFGNDYCLVYSTIWSENTENWISVATPGKYKVVCYIKNDSGQTNKEKYFEIIQKETSPVIVNCTRQCITGIVKKYTYKTLGTSTW